MKSRLVLTLVLLALATQSGHCGLRIVGQLPKPRATQQEARPQAQDNLVDRMVQVARQRYEAGKFEAADKILQAALEIDPTNQKAIYYLALVGKVIQANKEHLKTIRPWYPDLPPRPVQPD